MSCCGIGGSIIAVILILIIVKPVYEGMYEDVFLKIGGNGNMWEVYKYFTLCKSLLKLDFLISAEFMITIFFLSYNTSDSLKYLAVDVFFMLAILGNNIHGHILVLYCTIYLSLDQQETLRPVPSVHSSQVHHRSLQSLPHSHFLFGIHPRPPAHTPPRHRLRHLIFPIFKHSI